MIPDPDAGLLIKQPYTYSSLFRPHFSLLSFIVGLVTLSLAGFTGLSIGTYLKKYTPDTHPSSLPPQAVLQDIKPVLQNDTRYTFSKAMQCPDDGWLDCTSVALRSSSLCTPEHLAQVQDMCPNVHGARYAK